VLLVELVLLVEDALVEVDVVVLAVDAVELVELVVDAVLVVEDVVVELVRHAAALSRRS